MEGDQKDKNYGQKFPSWLKMGIQKEKYGKFRERILARGYTQIIGINHTMNY